jgi:pimeloyl-ACP methyl ester carboxylesterase
MQWIAALACACLAALGAALPVAAADSLYAPQADATVIPGQPYHRYYTADKWGRQITFYLSEAAPDAPSRPLAVFIQGSGCGSLFEAAQGKVLPSGGNATLFDVAGQELRVLLVEKPGLAFLEQPMGDCEANAEFNREFTLERWAEAIEAAVRAARQLPGIAADRTLVVGHSEGGLVACRVARDLPEVVTHVAVLAGEGPSQLYSLLALARAGVFFTDVSSDPEQRVQYVLDRWTQIQTEPDSADKFFFGFAYRRWASFLTTSPLDELLQVRCRICLAQGSEDQAVDPTSADMLYAQLLTHGKDVTYFRVQHANHSFRHSDEPRLDGWAAILRQVADWSAAAPPQPGG